MMKNIVKLWVLILCCGFSVNTFAGDYALYISHSAINFKIKLIGISWMTGRFNNFSGNMTYDGENIENSSIEILIDTGSIDTNHVIRDRHIRAFSLLDTDKFPEAKFISKTIKPLDDEQFEINGDFTFLGKTLPLVIAAQKVGEGRSAATGREHVGFEGTAKISLVDYEVGDYSDPENDVVELQLFIEAYPETS